MSQQTLEQQQLSDVVHKPSRWITVDQQTAFIAFITIFNLLEYIPRLKLCATQFAKYRCSKDHNHSKRGRYNFCGMRGICPRCSKIYAYKKSTEMYHWIKVNLANKLRFDLKMNHIILTLPQELNSSIDVKIFVRMVHDFMSKMGIEAYGYSIHERHTSTPLSGRFVHAHILSLNIKRGRKSLVRNDFYFDPLEMRQNWKMVIEQHTGMKIEGQVDLKNHYASFFLQKQRVLNMLAYLYRYPVVDLFETITGENQAYYLELMHFDSPESVALEIRSMAKTKPRFIWCGLMTPAKRGLLMSLIPSSNWQDMPMVRKTLADRTKTCLDCGALLESTPYEIVPYTGDNEPRSVSSVFYCSQNFGIIGRREN